jgi:hypothetical protein
LEPESSLLFTKSNRQAEFWSSSELLTFSPFFFWEPS